MTQLEINKINWSIVDTLGDITEATKEIKRSMERLKALKRMLPEDKQAECNVGITKSVADDFGQIAAAFESLLTD